MSDINRPLSPHLTIYRKQISSVLSILHRISGMAIFAGISIISWLLIIYVYSGFDSIFLNVMESFWFKIVIYVTLLSSCYHFFSGVRHLVWDLGYWFSIKAINVTGWITVILTIVTFGILVML